MLMVYACSGEDALTPPPDITGSAPDDAGDTSDADAIATDRGVTPEPCAQPAGGRANPGNGCIYLGVLSDLNDGPFNELGALTQRGLHDFWGRVNAAGGIGGFDIDVDTYTRDTAYDRQAHAVAYRAIEPDILLLAESLGSPTTAEILGDLASDDVIAASTSWWSGLHFDEITRGVILTSGYSYCLESMIGLDWYDENVRPVGGVVAVGYAGAYGSDVAQGARLWAEANDVPFLGSIRTGRVGVEVGGQEVAVQSIVRSGADVVVLGVGPEDAGLIVGGVEARAEPGQIDFLGSAPTWSPSLLAAPSAAALMGRYTNISPWEDFTGGSTGHAAMRAALGGDVPGNSGYAAGWVIQYPIRALLEAAVASGDLTRANIRSLVDGLEVDYEGILPPTRQGGDPNINVNRTAVIGRVDPERANGLSTIVDGYRGATADAFTYSVACSG